MNEVEDELVFAEEEPTEPLPAPPDGWKVLLVDDDAEIHRITKVVLADFQFNGKGLQFYTAGSAAEGRELLAQHPDAALMLLDVVMEQDNAGLELVRYIREQLRNELIRIILRTGQPGHAPEKKVIIEYDINDYKEKTELTAQKLFTAIAVALRSFRDLQLMQRSKRGLEEIAKSSAAIFEWQSKRSFAYGVLQRIYAVMNLPEHREASACFAFSRENESIQLLATAASRDGQLVITGHKTRCETLEQWASPTVREKIESAFANKCSCYEEDRWLLYFRSKLGVENVIYVRDAYPLNDWDRHLLEIYSANVAVAAENLYLNEEVELTQKEIIFTLGEIAETRSKETGYHVKRVAEYSRLLAVKSGLSEEEAKILHMASPMHDIGKIGIPDEVLHKPGKLTPEQFALIQTHTTIGYSMLNHSSRPVMKAAAVIAKEHHEKYDGSGYPDGLSGEHIHLYGRIVAVADVFDALGTARVYKPAWPLEQIRTYYEEQRGRHFDPVLTDLFLHHFDEFVGIQRQYADDKVF